MKLTDNFSRWEFEKSQTAIRKGIDNRMNNAQLQAAIDLCENVLEPARKHFGKPIIITSGFRSPKLNRAIGGAKGSQHSKGEAADIELVGGDNWHLLHYIHDNLPFDQLIAERMLPSDPTAGWVHVSFRKGNNREQALSWNGVHYTTGIDFA